LFYDVEFPANAYSISEDAEAFPLLSKMYWAGLSDINKNSFSNIHHQNICPSDVQQGQLGDYS